MQTEERGSLHDGLSPEIALASLVRVRLRSKQEAELGLPSTLENSSGDFLA
jgi:hypothetical protein